MISRVRTRLSLLPSLTLHAVLMAAIALAVSAERAAASCVPTTPTPCENCFAVFIMPDTQKYVSRPSADSQTAAHLNLVTQYACDHRTRWKEPNTGKVMPIQMLIQ